MLGFWVAPRKLVGSETLFGPVGFQITSVVSKMDAPDHFIVEVTVKNTGNIDWGFELFMSFLS
ncbi:MAG TPA: hypothetical protein VFP84_02665 [Kofleriaceae bacterium]|nr:hypothetical protein [Kofleriaceae bacterium]